MAFYESVFIARQNVSASAAESLADKFADIIKNNGGTVPKREYWGLRNFTYRINKNRKGHYFLFNLDAPHEAVKEMERLMKIDEDILRFLTVRVDALEEGPSAMMRARDQRDEGDTRRDFRSNDEDVIEGDIVEVIEVDTAVKEDVE